MLRLLFFTVECGMTRFLCAMRVFYAKFCFFHSLHCWASPWRKTAYSITHPTYLMPRELKRLCFRISHFVALELEISGLAFYLWPWPWTPWLWHKWKGQNYRK